MCLHCTFREHKYEILENIKMRSDKYMNDMSIFAPCMNPLQNYVDMMNVRLLSLSTDSSNTEDKHPFFTTEQLSNFTREINNLTPRISTGCKLVKESYYYQQFYSQSHSLKFDALLLSVEKFRALIFIEKEILVKSIYIDKFAKVTQVNEGLFKMIKPDRKSKKKRVNGEDDRKKQTIDLKLLETIEVKMHNIKDEFSDLQFEFY